MCSEMLLLRVVVMKSDTHNNMNWMVNKIKPWCNIDIQRSYYWFEELGIKRTYWIFVIWQKVEVFSIGLEFKDNSQFSIQRLVLILFEMTKRQLNIYLWSCCMDRKVRIGIIICIWKSERRHPTCGEIIHLWV